MTYSPSVQYDDIFRPLTEATHSAFYKGHEPITLTEYVIHHILDSTIPVLGDLQIEGMGDVAIAGRFQLRSIVEILEQEYEEGSTFVDPITIMTLQGIVRRDHSVFAPTDLFFDSKEHTTASREYNTMSDHRNLGFLMLHWLRTHNHMFTAVDHMTAISAQHSRALADIVQCDNISQDQALVVSNRFILLTLPVALVDALEQETVTRDLPWAWQEPLLADQVIENLAAQQSSDHLLEYAYRKSKREYR